MPGLSGLNVGRARLANPFGGGFSSPYLLEILSTRFGAPGFNVASGALTANTGQTVSCARTASAYVTKADGTLTLLGPNTVRVEPQGLLVEGSRQNTVLQSQALATTPWSTASISTLPTVTNNTGDVTDPAGGNTATKIVYPITTVAATDFCFVSQNGGSNNSLDSIYLRCLSGTQTIYLSSNSSSSSYTACVLTSTWQRFTHLRPNTAGDLFFVLGSDTRPGNGGTPGAAAQTIYAWGAQNEAAVTFATSYIPTTTVAVTRDADVVTVANPLNPSNPGTWRVGVRAIPWLTWASQVGTARLISIGNDGANNSVRGYVSTATASNWDLFDNVGGAKSIGQAAVFSGSAPASLTLIDTAGTLSTIPAGGAPTGAGTGVVTTQPASICLGGQVPFPSLNFSGWLTDIYADNK